MCRNIWHAFGFCFGFLFFVLENILKIRLLCIFEKQISHFSTQNILDQFDGRVLYFDKYLQRTEIFTSP